MVYISNENTAHNNKQFLSFSRICLPIGGADLD